MAQCPSIAAEQFSNSQEMPEKCPICGIDNCDDYGNWLCAAAPGFCSVEHQKQYMDEQVQLSNEMVAEVLEEEKMIREYNANCPRCKNSHKLCRHQD